MSTKKLFLAAAALALAVANDPIYDYHYRKVKYNSTRPKGLTKSQKSLFGEHNKPLMEFTIQGHKIMAFSKKDAITRLVHQGLIKRKK